ncbi:uncharacterized protein CTHT_0071260 [Thermochaetoides thermophila DSM 1495]|uniref:Uncharacterized protein n=1 Tax=Chaetomium thermophilum (strain DSM 1495 / CBS 144.50 / IMI 039719) TaxID=759272 RepID=G0SFL4_CHATD|nr:hypothetical protein CTHT_0071260 [Thermochaetoides thermophila DSM 1495]EGS17779.1 hypothetical protein CTHT_0071260 [Thermochaetoides thermophila DSM 1495]
MIDAVNSQRAAATASDLADEVRSQVTGQAVEAHRLSEIGPAPETPDQRLTRQGGMWWRWSESFTSRCESSLAAAGAKSLTPNLSPSPGPRSGQDHVPRRLHPRTIAVIPHYRHAGILILVFAVGRIPEDVDQHERPIFVSST